MCTQHSSEHQQCPQDNLCWCTGHFRGFCSVRYACANYHCRMTFLMSISSVSSTCTSNAVKKSDCAATDFVYSCGGMSHLCMWLEQMYICACKQTSIKQTPQDRQHNKQHNKQMWQQPTLSMMPYFTASYGSKYFGLLMVFSISSGSWSVCSPSNLTWKPQPTIRQISKHTHMPSNVSQGWHQDAGTTCGAWTSWHNCRKQTATCNLYHASMWEHDSHSVSNYNVGPGCLCQQVVQPLTISFLVLRISFL